jgi:hypothetical protein
MKKMLAGLGFSVVIASGLFANSLMMAVLHTPRIVAFIPGQSPPEVRIPILIVVFFSQKLGIQEKSPNFNDYFRRKDRKKR